MKRLSFNAWAKKFKVSSKFDPFDEKSKRWSERIENAKFITYETKSFIRSA